MKTSTNTRQSSNLDLSFSLGNNKKELFVLSLAAPGYLSSQSVIFNKQAVLFVTRSSE